jgi:hypothetical protein
MVPLLAFACGGSSISSPDEIVESIELSLSDVQILVGGSVDLVAIAKNDLGVEVDLTGLEISWISENAAVASVDQAGIVTGEAPGGPVEITARLTVPALEASANVTVLAELPPGSALHPHEPAGMIPLYNNDGRFAQLAGNNLASSGWFESSSQWESLATIVSDPTNPTGSGQSVELTHPAGGGGPAAKLNRFSQLGSALGGTGYTGGGVAEQYLSLRIKIPTGEPGCDGVFNGMKLFYLGMEAAAKNGEGANEFFAVVCANEGWQIQHGGSPAPNPADVFTSFSWPPSTNATWHMEIYRVAESSNGAGDGTMRIWINGKEVSGSPWRGLDWSDPSRSGRLFDGMELYHTQHSPSSTHKWLQQELYISGR